MKNKILLLFLFLIIYQVIVFMTPGRILPSLTEILQTSVSEFSSGQVYADMFSSLQRVTVGFFLASIFGIILGLLFGSNVYLNNLQFLIDLLRPIPPIAWIPIAIIFFGLGDTSAYFIVFLGAFFPIFTNTYLGSVSIPRIYKNISSVFELGFIKYYTKILLYYSLPFIFAGLKIGIGMAWMSVIAAELVGAQSGLGYYIQISRLLLRIDKVIIGMVLIGTIGFILQKIIEIIEKLLMPWREQI